MGAHPASEIGEPGTSRYIRNWQMKGISQRKFGEMCKPQMDQAQVSQFDRAQLRMTWKLARRIAPALEPDLWAGNDAQKRVAELKTWQVWFRNVEVYGGQRMKQFASEMLKKVGAEIFTEGKTLWDLQVKSEGARAVQFSTNEHAPAGTIVRRAQA